jgi:hypothetical protein
MMRAKPWVCPSCKKPRMATVCKTCRLKREDAAALATKFTFNGEGPFVLVTEKKAGFA